MRAGGVAPRVLTRDAAVCVARALASKPCLRGQSALGAVKTARGEAARRVSHMMQSMRDKLACDDVVPFRPARRPAPHDASPSALVPSPHTGTPVTLRNGRVMTPRRPDGAPPPRRPMGVQFSSRRLQALPRQPGVPMTPQRRWWEQSSQLDDGKASKSVLGGVRGPSPTGAKPLVPTFSFESHSTLTEGGAGDGTQPLQLVGFDLEPTPKNTPALFTLSEGNVTDRVTRDDQCGHASQQDDGSDPPHQHDESDATESDSDVDDDDENSVVALRPLDVYPLQVRQGGGVLCACHEPRVDR